jgi:hypothetical protein
MSVSELLYSPLLNFVFENLSGVDEAVILRKGVDFFKDLETVKSEKAKLWSFVNENDPPVRRGTNAILSHLQDIIDFMKKCDADGKQLPCFVIKRPTEVPVISATAFTHVTAKLTSLEQAISLVSAKIDSYNLNFPQIPVISQPAACDTHTTILISDPPPEHGDPLKRKSVIDSISGHQLVSRVQATKKRWTVNIEKSAAEDFCKSAKEALPGSSVKVLSKKHTGVIREVPSDFDLEMLRNQFGIIGSSRFGTSKSVKLEFADAITKGSFLRNGVKIGYENFRVYEFKQLPKCCFKCRSPGHLESACTSSTPKCARCAGPHLSTNSDRCTESPKCANCGGSHPSYSLRCPVIKKITDKVYSQK